MRRLFSFLLVLAVVGGTSGPLLAESLVSDKDGSFLGYRLGMSFREAERVRPFDKIHSPPSSAGRQDRVVATVHSLGRDGVPLQYSVAFKDDRLVSIVATFDNADLASVKWQLEKVFGPASEKTRTKQVAETHLAQTSLTWETGGEQLQLTVFPRVTPNFTVVLQFAKE